jgi:eight-cysteine-cluster-containing protein|tara:strand:- start:1592 stop:1882 length:291 start_codon:yes stop_codon:yes gene_type:complete
MKKLFILFLILVIGCTNIQDTPKIDNVECSMDSDCSIGGCSGQICGVKGEVENIITTCEYKEEYGCYKLTNCDCTNNKCNWVENNEFNSCLDEFSN